MSDDQITRTLEAIAALCRAALTDGEMSAPAALDAIIDLVGDEPTPEQIARHTTGRGCE